MALESPYQSFFIKNHLGFIEGKGGLSCIKVDNNHASALISLYGAQVLSYQPKSSNTDSDLLFISETAYFEEGKAIKGGIPICWPWFGKDPEGLGRQMHGFARNMLWQLEETTSTSNETVIVLSLSDAKDYRHLWTHDFKLTLKITVGEILSISLKTENTGDERFKITQAMHAYFSVDDIDQIRVGGLESVEYIDTVNGLNELVVQNGDIEVNQEIDRIYINAPKKTLLLDEKLKRKLTIESIGSETTVVWNPWKDISKNSADLRDDAYKQFICIETANAARDVIVIPPSESFTLEAKYSVRSI